MGDVYISITGILLISAIIYLVVINRKINRKVEEAKYESDKRNIDLMEQAEKYKQQAEISEKEKLSLQKKLDTNYDKITGLTAEKEKLLTELKFKNQEIDKQKLEAENWHKKFKSDFEVLANEILTKKSEKFTEYNKKNIEAILNPLRENIQKFEQKVEDKYLAEAKERSGLLNQIKHLTDLNQKVREEANNLTNALKSQSKAQGNWGEMILETILENSGLVEGVEYEKQASFKDEDGKRYQPDVLVHYPGDKHVIIDSKVSLTAYEQYVNSNDEKEQENALKQHLVSVKNHINELAAKNYQDIYKLNYFEFVILFMPVEPAFMIALQNSKDLWQYAFEKRIMMVGPTNLIASLKMIANMWQQEKFNKNARVIADESGKMLDKLYGFIEDYKKVGDNIKKLEKEYNNSMNKLSEGNGNLLRKAQQIKELGVKTKKDIKEDDKPEQIDLQ